MKAVTGKPGIPSLRLEAAQATRAMAWVQRTKAGSDARRLALRALLDATEAADAAILSALD